MVTDVEYITFMAYYDQEQTFYLPSARRLPNADSHAHINLSSLYSAPFFLLTASTSSVLFPSFLLYRRPCFSVFNTGRNFFFFLSFFHSFFFFHYDANWANVATTVLHITIWCKTGHITCRKRPLFKRWLLIARLYTLVLLITNNAKLCFDRTMLLLNKYFMN
jgi:hypothetical protein